MKRSEALGLIWEAINELEDADHILKRLEDAGMLPPDHGKDWNHTLDSHKWEPEDE